MELTLSSKNELRVALMQPSFLSWTGYFELIDAVDLFVFLDDFQFSRRSWGKKNKLLINKKETIISFPIKHSDHFATTFNETHILIDKRWEKKFLRSICESYGKAKYFEQIYPKLKEWLCSPHKNLANMLIDFTLLVKDYLSIPTETKRSSSINYNRNLYRSWKIASLLEATKATAYYSALGSFGYMREDNVFPNYHVQIYFQNHVPIPYTQIGSSHFVSHLSILDALFNLSPEETRRIMRGTAKWLTWAEAEQQVKIK